MAVLRVLQGLTPGAVFPLEGASVVLGRHPACDIVLESASVSRQHARILNVDGVFYLEDLHSRNGTSVNGQPITERRVLNEDDEVRVCDLAFTFHLGLPESSVAPATYHGDVPTEDMMVDDDQQASESSTLMSKLNIPSGSTEPAVGNEHRGETEGPAGDQPTLGEGPGAGRSLAQAAGQPVCDFLAGRPRFHRAPRSGQRPGGAEGDQVSPPRGYPQRAHQPHDRQQRDGEQRGDAFGRCRRRLRVSTWPTASWISRFAR